MTETTLDTASALLWEGPIVMEGALTGDGRLIEAGALTWGDLPIPLRRVVEDSGAHDGARAVGRILHIERRDGGVIWARGDFDAGSEAGLEAARVVAERISDGVSVDLDSVAFEIRVARELVEGLEQETPEAAELAEDEEGRVTVLDIEPDDEVFVTTEARIRAATLVDIPAFAEARIAVVSPDAGEETQDEEEDGMVTGLAEEDAAGTVEGERSLVASASALRPTREWFTDPGLSEVTPLTVTEDGRVYGHLAAWDTCHTSYTPEGMCVQPPSSSSRYAYFHVSGPILTAEGDEVAVGKIIVNTRHAGRRLNAVSSLAHYEDTGATAAFVRAGEDAFGIWVAGMVNPDATEQQVRALRSSPLSGDWRSVGGAGLELVAALSVNVPGFPIPRPSGLVASGSLQSLVASGMVPPKRVPAPSSPNALSTDDLRYLKRLAAREREQEARARAESLAARVAAVRPSEETEEKEKEVSR